MRGTSPTVRRAHVWHGLIPAGAGNILDLVSDVIGSAGSSPQVRGTSLGIANLARPLRLIPAGAGNILWLAHGDLLGQGSSPQVRGTSPASPPAPPTPRAHPRRCGEHSGTPASGVPSPGSSPQVRGTSRGRADVNCVLRLIPAGAGNITSALTIWTCPRAHPRRCGEHIGEGASAVAILGSSPQVRGTCADPLVACRHAGLIPAGAGNIAAWL